jgi:hypothetical protein
MSTLENINPSTWIALVEELAQVRSYMFYDVSKLAIPDTTFDRLVSEFGLSALEPPKYKYSDYIIFIDTYDPNCFNKDNSKLLYHVFGEYTDSLIEQYHNNKDYGAFELIDHTITMSLDEVNNIIDISRYIIEKVGNMETVRRSEKTLKSMLKMRDKILHNLASIGEEEVYDNNKVYNTYYFNSDYEEITFLEYEDIIYSLDDIDGEAGNTDSDIDGNIDGNTEDDYNDSNIITSIIIAYNNSDNNIDVSDNSDNNNRAAPAA